MSFFKRVLISPLVACVLMLGTSCTDGRSGINPGDRAPNVVGVDSSGATSALWDIQGKLFLVNFWATWCAPCIEEMPALQSLHVKFKDRGFQVVGIAVDDTEENVREVVQRYGITYPIIIDNKAQSKRQYQVKGFPESFLLDGEHRVMVVSDPADGTPQTRLWGPREWDSPAVGHLINSFLK
jgi:peroxiredoxin